VPYGRLLLLYPIPNCCCCIIYQTAAAALPCTKLLLLYHIPNCCSKNVFYRTQSLITVLIQPLLSQRNSTDILIHYLLMINFNIIISSTATSSNVPLQVPLQLNYWAPCYAVFFVPSFFLKLRNKHFLQQLILKHYQSMFLHLKDQVSHSCKTTGKIIILYAVINTSGSETGRQRGCELKCSKCPPNLTDH